MSREDNALEQFTPLTDDEEALRYINLRRGWSTWEYFAEKSRVARALFVLSALVAVGFFAATAVGASGAYV